MALRFRILKKAESDSPALPEGIEQEVPETIFKSVGVDPNKTTYSKDETKRLRDQLARAKAKQTKEQNDRLRQTNEGQWERTRGQEIAQQEAADPNSETNIRRTATNKVRGFINQRLQAIGSDKLLSKLVESTSPSATGNLEYPVDEKTKIPHVGRVAWVPHTNTSPEEMDKWLLHLDDLAQNAGTPENFNDTAAVARWHKRVADSRATKGVTKWEHAPGDPESDADGWRGYTAHRYTRNGRTYIRANGGRSKERIVP